MKKRLLVFLLSPLLSSFNSMAQNWVNGGNPLTGNGTLGTTTNFSVIFKTNNSERGRITNSGLWGFGTTAPNSKVHISSPSGQVPLRVEENGFTQLLVNNGVTIGSNSTTPPANGLYVKGNVGIGTSAPENKLHVFSGSAGNVTGYFQAPLLVENSSHCYINILAPDLNETGILFGRPSNPVDGGLLYNDAAMPNGMTFTTSGNKPRMFINPRGQVGLGTDPGFYKMKILLGGPQEFTDGFAIANVTGDNWSFFPLQGNGMAPTVGGLELDYNGSLRGEFFKTNGVYATISDRRLKTNIKPMGTMLEKIMQLKPSTYQFKNTKDTQEYNGFIAQDVMKVFPGLVSHIVDPERKLDVYTMDYSGFGVLAIKGIQELQPVIEEQKEKITKLEDGYKLKIATLEDRMAKVEAAIATIASYKNGNTSTAIANVSLEQNNPNPFNKNTTIRYSIPRGSKGQINIYDQTGKIVKALTADESGRCELSGYDLTAGAYTYALIINGKVASARQMLIIK